MAYKVYLQTKDGRTYELQKEFHVLEEAEAETDYIAYNFSVCREESRFDGAWVEKI